MADPNLSDEVFDPGAFRHRVTWMSKTLGSATLGSAGQKIPTYTKIGTYWADCKPLRGFELFHSAQLKASTAYKIRMRNVGAIKPGDRLIFEATARVFEVVGGFRPMEQNALLQITANELLSA